MAAASGALGLVAISQTAATIALAFGAAAIATSWPRSCYTRRAHEEFAAVFAALFFAGSLPLLIAAVAIG